MAKRCRHPNGVTIKPNGIDELLPCRVRLKEIHRNVTVHVSQCPVCGYVDLSWYEQEDSEHEILGELGPEPEDD